ncbi:hypothetical protein BS50DRAFT_199724 [Corynespora cassiicola Philippines]|uniref:Uncharacterized protein n=1 Tax=Corynespora cassiicola Philippines TaxID=1448308 RepID=A0A2T2N5Y9_CORCC|nr:hypothetical protein BS50DRAFT_199724 [Corynespora cassiicola Philippines]
MMPQRKPQRKPQEDQKLSGFPFFMAQDSKVYYSDFRSTRKRLNEKEQVLLIKHLAKTREKKGDERNIALTRCFFHAQSKSGELKAKGQGTVPERNFLNEQHDLLVRLQKTDPKDYSNSQKAYVKEIRGKKHQQAIKFLEDM